MAAQIKQEPGAATPYIKPDPDSKATSMGAIEEEDIYEDAGDLDFSNAGQNVWLLRIPKQLWEHWSKIDDDEEIQIGTVRVEGTPTDIKRVGSPLGGYVARSTGIWRLTGFCRSVCASTNGRTIRTFPRTTT